MYDWDFHALLPYAGQIWAGLLVTLALAGVSIVVGTLAGFVLGFFLRTRLVIVRSILLAIVDVIRSIPVLILLLATNYYLPSILGLEDLKPFTIAAVALSLNLAAFTADVVRGAIIHVEGAEIEAARSIGLSEWAVLCRFTLPRVIRVSMPTLALLFIATAKNTALASVISVFDLTHTANLIASVKMKTLEVYAVVTGIYILLILPFSIFARRLEHRNAGPLEAVNA
jgi:polar amino acid transport system permease protein